MSLRANLLKYNKCDEKTNINAIIKEAKNPIFSLRKKIGINTKIIPKIAGSNLRVKSLSPNKKKQ